MLLALDTIVPFLVVSAKKPMKQKDRFQSSFSPPDMIGTQIYVHNHKAFNKFLVKSRQTGWILTWVKAAITEHTISLLSHHHTTDKWKREKMCCWWNKCKNPQPKKHKIKKKHKDQQPGWLWCTMISDWALPWFVVNCTIYGTTLSLQSQFNCLLWGIRATQWFLEMRTRKWC